MDDASADLASAAKTFVDNIKAGDEVEVIAFSDSYRVVATFSSDKQIIKAGIDNFYDGGYTALYDSIYKAISDMKQYSKNGAKSIVAMTDGQNNRGTKSIDDVITFAKSEGIPIFTVGLGSSIQDTELKRIANETNAGKSDSGYYYAPTSTQLQDLYSNISKTIQNVYRITWKSSGQTGNNVDVNIGVTYTAALGKFTDSFNLKYFVP